MIKKTILFQGPCFTRSGYGDHSRDLLKSLKMMDKYDVKIIPTRWGNTPQDQVNSETEFGRWMLERVTTQVTQKPDIFIQISVANEFQPRGSYNIGITAGVETSICPKDFIDGSNKMDLIIVPSQFTRKNLLGTVYQEKDKQSGQIIGEHRITKPVEVLFEGVDLDVFLTNPKTDVDILKQVETEFNFLMVGHWLKGDIGQDRKDIGMTIKTIASVFQYIPKEKRPGLIIKTSHAGFSVLDREIVREKIESVISNLGDKCLPIYLIHGDLSENEMSGLYNHPKVKAMVSFTKGEGYGRPLAEFATTGKPIIVSKWSGQTDFLPEPHTIYLDGTLTDVHESAADKFILKESKWFTVNYSDAANKIFDLFNNYDAHLSKSTPLKQHIKQNFNLTLMKQKFQEMLEQYTDNIPKVLPFNLPKLNKDIKVPKLQKVK